MYDFLPHGKRDVQNDFLDIGVIEDSDDENIVFSCWNYDCKRTYKEIVQRRQKCRLMNVFKTNCYTICQHFLCHQVDVELTNSPYFIDSIYMMQNYLTLRGSSNAFWIIGISNDVLVMYKYMHISIQDHLVLRVSKV